MKRRELEKMNKDELIALLLSNNKYGLNWERENKNTIEDVVTSCENNYPLLKEVKSKRIKGNGLHNYIIEGDNYHTLKVLEYTHKNSIDVIYIDPPYNTGNQFIYNDKFVSDEDTFRHSKWLNFMEKRLKIAKKLLSENGIMYISIDDYEYANLKLLVDNIFGEKNIETIIWNLDDLSEGSFKKTSGNTLRKLHEYILVCYNGEKKLNKYIDETLYDASKAFSNPDGDPRGDWMSANISRNGIKSTTGSKYFEIVNPAGESFKRNWTITYDEYLELEKKGLMFYGKDGSGVPRMKKFKTNVSPQIQSSILSNVKTSKTGKKELTSLVENHSFDYPKPTKLIERLCEIAPINKTDAIILDFFAGTGTTLHAATNMNVKDGGTRQVILCTNNENNIAQNITYKRAKSLYKHLELDNDLVYLKTNLIAKTNNNERNRRLITSKVNDIISFKEDKFNELMMTESFAVFEDNFRNKIVVYFSPYSDSLYECIETVKKLESVSKIYYYNQEHFKDMLKVLKIDLEEIPSELMSVLNTIEE